MDSSHIMDLVQMSWYHFIYSEEKEHGHGKFFEKDAIEHDDPQTVSESEFENGALGRAPDFSKVAMASSADVTALSAAYKSLISDVRRAEVLEKIGLTATDVSKSLSQQMAFQPASVKSFLEAGDNPFVLRAAHTPLETWPVLAPASDGLDASRPSNGVSPSDHAATEESIHAFAQKLNLTTVTQPKPVSDETSAFSVISIPLIVIPAAMAAFKLWQSAFRSGGKKQS